VQPEQRLTSATLGRSLSKRQRLACAGAGQAACTARACRAAAARQPDGAGERARGARQRGAQLPAALRTAVARASRGGRRPKQAQSVSRTLTLMCPCCSTALPKSLV